MEATAEHKPIQDYPLNPDEMWAEKGDTIVVKSPIDQNGYIRGKNPNLNTEGRFPMYLLKEHLIFDNFSAFFNISI
uniref:SH3 domain-containing protein n=1 Tax=Meloidogyne javanica TaxID=6303 RepID=A0A915MCM5_MELJA